jgi:lipopolysaccharide/colanic/teichoic acid biosynthesis glycosyltransferase
MRVARSSDALDEARDLRALLMSEDPSGVRPIAEAVPVFRRCALDERYRRVPVGAWLLGAFTRMIGIVALVFMLPALAIFGLAVKFTSPGPVLFRQRRVGANGREFVLYGFRTMKVDADRFDHGDVFRLLAANKSDPRMTTLGRFLRETSLDSLPQLLNLVRGELALVGPPAGYPYTGAAEQLPRKPGLLQRRNHADQNQRTNDRKRL